MRKRRSTFQRQINKANDSRHLRITSRWIEFVRRLKAGTNGPRRALQKAEVNLMDARSPYAAASEGLLDHLEHRLFKKPLWAYLRDVHPLVILTSPIVYLCAIPFLALDLAVTVYQAICLPVYGIAKVPRRDYLVFDRGRLAYLNAIEKVACVYCSYANGLLAYIVEIAARTEQHFCPIKHARAPLRPHSHYPAFVPYGDPRAYRKLVDRIAPAPAPPRSA